MRLIQQVKRNTNVWSVASFFFIFLILLPNILIAINSFSPASENWAHIKEYLLGDMVRNTSILLIFTGVFTMGIGTSLAWLVTVYTFPLRNFFKWGLILPLAVPPFIGAYTYHGMLSYTGTIQTTLRNTFGLQLSQDYFNIMTMQGAIFIFTLFLYPYVFVVTKSFFENQSSSLIENARLLGSNSFGIFFKVVLPISRTAIIGGGTIVLLEVINDYGVVKLFGIQTFITSIFQTWFSMGDLDASFKIAGSLMVVVIIILLLEQILRGRKRYSSSSTKMKPIQPKKLRGWKAWGVFSYCVTIFSFAFFIPFVQLVVWTTETYERIVTIEFLTLVRNSFFSAAIAAICIVSIALIIANYSRLHTGIIPTFISKVTILGYSVPGAVISIGIITVFIAIDQFFATFTEMLSLESTIVLRTSIVMLICAYIIRFLAVGYNSIEAGFTRIGTKYTEAARMLGSSIHHSFFKVDIPMMKGAIVGGFILVFVDILKELPLTMLLQPFNFQTLATRAFRYASDEMIHEAASASLLIIIISAASIFVFHKILDKGE